MIPFRNDKVLILKRENGLWEFPGGGVEWGEAPEDCARRELREETSLETTGLTLLGITSATYEKEGNEKHSVYLVYKGKCDVGEPRITEEHKEYRWLTPNELKLISPHIELGLNAKYAIELL